MTDNVKGIFAAKRAIMFDMDGVLFDSMKNHAKSWCQTMHHYGFSDFTEEEAYMHEGRTGAGTINTVSRRMFGGDVTEQEEKEIYQYKANLFNSMPIAPPMPGAFELLQKVVRAGITPILVTGSGQRSLLGRLNEHFPGIFRSELMVTAFDVTRGKPDPEPYLMGIRKYNDFFGTVFGPDYFVVVENAPLGVQAAVRAGVFTIAVNTGPLPDEALLSQGANLLFPSMQSLCDQFDTLL